MRRAFPGGLIDHIREGSLAEALGAVGYPTLTGCMTGLVSAVAPEASNVASANDLQAVFVCADMPGVVNPARDLESGASAKA